MNTAPSAARLHEEISGRRVRQESTNDDAPMTFQSLDGRTTKLELNNDKLIKDVRKLESENAQYALCVQELNRQVVELRLEFGRELEELRRELQNAHNRMTTAGIAVHSQTLALPR